MHRVELGHSPSTEHASSGGTRGTTAEDDMTRPSEEHERALEELGAALNERNRLTGRYEAAVGTSTELSASVQLRAAADQVNACAAWLQWVDDGGERGPGRDPLDLPRELEQTLGAVR
jgi:hypothetical protein